MRIRGGPAPSPASVDLIGRRITDAIDALCHPAGTSGTSVSAMGAVALSRPLWHWCADADIAPAASTMPDVTVDELVVRLFEEEGSRLVRLVRLVVDDRNAAEDIVQEGFIRLARSAGRITDQRKAAAYLRSIVLNLARDQNRRGLVSLRHHLPFDDVRASTEDEIVVRDDQREVIEALRALPHRQRDCLVLRYYEELGIDDIAETLGISRNSVKTHLKRGLASMEQRIGLTRGEPATEPAPEEVGVSVIEHELRDALFEASSHLDESEDLFARVLLSIEDDRKRRVQRRRRAGVVACFLAAIGSVVAATVDHTQGELTMDWWILELIWLAVMVGLALWLGPFIKRFGKSYAADVFRANPRTGKSFIVLMDVAYYLIFTSFILFTVQFQPASDWDSTVTANQLRATTVRIGGILLIVGILHGLNVLTLPLIGRILTLNRHLDESSPPPPSRSSGVTG